MTSSDGSTGWEPAVGADLWSLGDLELELVRVRSEARAARLEARAAELELQARRLRSSEKTATGPPIQKRGQDSFPAGRRSVGKSVTGQPTAAPADVGDRDPGAADLPVRAPVRVVEPPPTAPPVASGWEELAVAAKQRLQDASPQDASPPREAGQDAGPRQDGARRDTEHPAPGPPARQRFSRPTGQPSEDATKADAKVENPAKGPRKHRSATRRERRKTGDRRAGHEAVHLQTQKAPRPALPKAEWALRADEPPVAERRRPVAWVASTLAHILILLLLAALTLSVPEPQDQLAFSA